MYRRLDVTDFALDDRLRERARIVAAEDGGVLRTLLGDGVKKASGFYASARTGLYHPWKQTLERLRFWLCEVDPSVGNYVAQPHRVDVPVDGEHKPLFFPDLRIDYRNGDVCIETIVDRGRPPSKRVIAIVSDLYEGIGWTYRIVKKRHITRGFALDNARVIERDKFTKITTGTLNRAQDFLAAKGGVVAYARLVEALGNPTVGRARLHALIVRGHLDFDIEARLKADSQIRSINGGTGGAR